jgi:hypothetical protein
MVTVTTVINTARVIVVIDPGLQVHLELDFHLQLNDWRRPESPDKEET